MKKYLVAVVLISLLSQKSYSSSTPDSLLKEINLRLAEGLECKQLLEEKSIQLKEHDSIITALEMQVVDLNKALVASQENTTFIKQREAIAIGMVEKAKAECEKDRNDVIRLRKGRNTWRLISFIETLLITGFVYLTVR